MNFSEYQVYAERTLPAAQSVHEAMISAALGICGEAAEVASAYQEQKSSHVLEECGDLLWYAAQMCKACGISLAEFAPHDIPGEPSASLGLLWFATGKLADMTKKEVFHKKETSIIDRWHVIDAILSAVDTLLGFYGFTVQDACGHNVEKLLKRFPNGFNHADANARKDEATP